MDDGFTKYTAGPGMIEFRKAICAKLSQENGIDYDPSEILVSNGEKQSLYNVCQALFQVEDEVLVFKPYWVSFPEFVRVENLIVVTPPPTTTTMATTTTTRTNSSSVKPEHTAALEDRGPAPDDVAARWAEILEVCGGEMPRFPLPVGDPAPGALPVVEVREVLDAIDYDAFAGAAKAAGTSTIGLAMSALTEVTRRVADAPLRAVFPVHSRHEPRWHDSSGWFITNSVLECVDDAPAACAASVKEAITLGSHPLAPILEPYGGMKVPRGMFALSWLDTRRLPVELDDDLDAQYVSAVAASDDVMVWFVVNRRGLHLRCRYPDTDEAVASVGGWLDAVAEGFLARLPDRTALVGEVG